jgi:hypothetical protein
MSNGKPRHVADAARSSYRRVRTASGVPHADVLIISRLARSAGTRPTRKRATTRRARTTTPGRVAALLSTTERSRSPLMATVVSGVVGKLSSSITRMGTGTTRTSTIWKYYANAVTSSSMTVLPISRRESSSRCASVSVAVRDSVLQDLVAHAAGDVEDKKRRYSQCPGKPGKNTLNYGMGPLKLANALKCSLNEAKRKIATYKERYPTVERFMREAIEEGREYGYAFTIMGRRRNIPMIASTRKEEAALGERLAVNTQIQGSAADVCRMAQINIDAYGLDQRNECHMLLQVHDELVFECPEDTADECKDDIEELMAHPFSIDLMVPLIAEVGIGNSWGEAK